MHLCELTDALRLCIVDTDVLRYFQQVVDGATVTEVAELYQVSQPGVSRGLKRLEEEVGTPLLCVLAGCFGPHTRGASSSGTSMRCCMRSMMAWPPPRS